MLAVYGLHSNGRPIPTTSSHNHKRPNDSLSYLPPTPSRKETAIISFLQGIQNNLESNAVLIVDNEPYTIPSELTV